MTLERAAVLFNGTYTIQNKETGEHRTFKIETQDEEAPFAPGKRIVSLLNGPDNERDFKGFGFVDDEGIRVWSGKAKREADGKRTVWEAYALMLWDLTVLKGEHLGEKYTVQESSTCLRCNKTLTAPESLARGVGPICAGL